MYRCDFTRVTEVESKNAHDVSEQNNNQSKTKGAFGQKYA